LLYRERFGEELNPSSPLIRKEFDKTDSFKIRNPGNVSTECFGFLLTELSYAAGVQQEQHLIERSEDEKEGKSLSRRAIKKRYTKRTCFSYIL
jgi:hypothetical protein